MATAARGAAAVVAAGLAFALSGCGGSSTPTTPAVSTPPATTASGTTASDTSTSTSTTETTSTSTSSSATAATSSATPTNLASSLGAVLGVKIVYYAATKAAGITESAKADTLAEEMCTRITTDHSAQGLKSVGAWLKDSYGLTGNAAALVAVAGVHYQCPQYSSLLGG